MKKATLIGDCAPIIMGGGKLEGVEREKVESPTRTYFVNAAKANGYPVALCKAMVTMNLEVYQVKNLQTNEYEYFEEEDLPTDSFVYGLEGKKLIVKGDQLLTLGADEAYSYGLARVVVDDLEEAVAFLEGRDKVAFGRPVETVDTNWSEGVVRWLNSPAVTGILLMVGLLGVYAELNSPGLGFRGGGGDRAGDIVRKQVPDRDGELVGDRGVRDRDIAYPGGDFCAARFWCGGDIGDFVDCVFVCGDDGSESA